MPASLTFESDRSQAPAAGDRAPVSDVQALPPAPLTLEEKRTLLRLARRAIEAAVAEKAFVLPDESVLTGRLAQPGASFVTLTLRETGELRGCTGSMEATEPLALNVCYCAVQTALYDYRFPPVSPEELEDIEIEISVLTTPQPLAYDSPEALLRMLEEEKPGVLIKRGAQRATFLPQVWERLPEAGLFMAYLCAKAGLSADDYLRPGLEVFTYQVEKFTESEVLE